MIGNTLFSLERLTPPVHTRTLVSIVPTAKNPNESAFFSLTTRKNWSYQISPAGFKSVRAPTEARP
jgi:hypothetical protein